MVMRPLTAFTPLAEKMAPVLLTPAIATDWAALMAFVTVIPPVSQSAAWVVPVEPLMMIWPLPRELALLIWMTPLTMVVVPERDELFAVTMSVPRSFFWIALAAALKVNAVSNVAAVPAVTSIPTVAAFRLIVRPLSV